jgi:hypothetical protein
MLLMQSVSSEVGTATIVLVGDLKILTDLVVVV